MNRYKPLNQLKPRLLGFFKGGWREFEQTVQGALGELLKKNDSEDLTCALL
ncbi:MAG: hypothetical protein VBE63_25065 [Lamprobacter sp.]|uniref:hypothetical protein n=1 Tax=Lamprobacter sp. TaxID=3100796 RepID=UPI002B257705|nr:hypothetical protein [Lamprobacter sp.]MEA3643183.1 hypothetical protein [Lamprobacter sp.]